MRNPNSDPTFSEIGKRWLQGKKDELFGKPGRRAASGEAAQEQAERDARDKVAREAFVSAVPGLRGAMERQEQAEVQREADERAALLGRGRAALELTVRGAIDGSWHGELPVSVEQRGDQLAWELDIPDDLAPTVGGYPFYGLRFRVEGYHGPGEYDLSQLVEPDPFAYECALASREEGFYWVKEEGAAHVSVGPDEKTVALRMDTTGASGTLAVHATLRLP